MIIKLLFVFIYIYVFIFSIEFFIDEKYKVFQPPIGEGVFAKVYKAELLDKYIDKNDLKKQKLFQSKNVAIKGF